MQSSNARDNLAHATTLSQDNEAANTMQENDQLPAVVNDIFSTSSGGHGGVNVGSYQRVADVERLIAPGRLSLQGSSELVDTVQDVVHDMDREGGLLSLQASLDELNTYMEYGAQQAENERKRRHNEYAARLMSIARTNRLLLGRGFSGRSTTKPLIPSTNPPRMRYARATSTSVHTNPPSGFIGDPVVLRRRGFMAPRPTTSNANTSKGFVAQPGVFMLPGGGTSSHPFLLDTTERAISSVSIPVIEISSEDDNDPTTSIPRLQNKKRAQPTTEGGPSGDKSRRRVENARARVFTIVVDSSDSDREGLLNHLEDLPQDELVDITLPSTTPARAYAGGSDHHQDLEDLPQDELVDITLPSTTPARAYVDGSDQHQDTNPGAPQKPLTGKTSPTVNISRAQLAFLVAQRDIMEAQKGQSPPIRCSRRSRPRHRAGKGKATEVSSTPSSGTLGSTNVGSSRLADTDPEEYSFTDYSPLEMACIVNTDLAWNERQELLNNTPTKQSGRAANNNRGNKSSGA